MNNSLHSELLYNGEGHLSDEGIAFWIDCISDNRKNRIPSSMINHVEECRLCASRIIETQVVIDAISQDLPVNKRVYPLKHINIRKILATAAIIIVLAVMASVLFYLLRPQDNQDVFADYFQPYPDVITTKNHPSQTSEPFLMKGLFYYNYSVYDSASQYFAMGLNARYSDTLSLYLGVTFLASKKTDKAIPLLEDISAQPGCFQETASWYLALAYIHSSQYEKAETILSRMVSEHSVYEESAESVLDRIRP